MRLAACRKWLGSPFLPRSTRAAGGSRLERACAHTGTELGHHWYATGYQSLRLLFMMEYRATPPSVALYHPVDKHPTNLDTRNETVALAGQNENCSRPKRRPEGS